MGEAAVAERARQYLDASTSGRWEEAKPYVADDAWFVFPTGTFRSLDEMRTGLQRRYTDLVKHFDTIDVAPRPDGSVVVVVAGTLAGVNLHGVPFADVRFLDRLVFVDDLVVEQHVYNDLAVSGVLERTRAGT